MLFFAVSSYQSVNIQLHCCQFNVCTRNRRSTGQRSEVNQHASQWNISTVTTECNTTF